MDFLELLDKKAEEKNWLNFFLALLEFLNKKELEWTSDDNQIKDTYYAIIPGEKDIDGGLKIIFSMAGSDYTIVVEDNSITLMNIYCVMEEAKTELHGFYRHDKIIEAVIFGKGNKVLVKKFKNLHNKLIHSRLVNRT